MRIGGAERALYQLIRAQRGTEYLPALTVISEGGLYAEKVAALGVRVFELNQRRPTDLSVRRLFQATASEYDLIHFHDQSPALMYLAARLKNHDLSTPIGAAIMSIAGHVA